MRKRLKALVLARPGLLQVQLSGEWRAQESLIS
jgi:hypothetical protein